MPRPTPRPTPRHPLQNELEAFCPRGRIWLLADAEDYAEQEVELIVTPALEEYTLRLEQACHLEVRLLVENTEEAESFLRSFFSRQWRTPGIVWLALVAVGSWGASQRQGVGRERCLL